MQDSGSCIELHNNPEETNIFKNILHSCQESHFTSEQEHATLQ